MTRLLLLGWDAADWKVIDPLLAKGEMPHLASLLSGGVRGNLSTIYPPLSPMVWTSIATGKRPTRHGIHGFTEPTEDGLGIRPISNLGRKTKALWNILNQEGKRSIVVGWWPSHPAEPIDGVMVSDHFPLESSQDPKKPLLPGTIWPPAFAARLASLRVHATEIPGEILRLFVPELEKVDQEADKSLHDLAGIIAETMSIHNAATELIEHEPWDLAAVYFTGIDHFSHRFMRYHARKARRRGATDTHPDVFRDIVVNGYRYHDLMLGRMMALAGPDCAVMIVSDHGFHSDRLLPDHIPAEAAGPAVEHRDFGVFCLKADGVRAGERIYGASVLDVTPTALHVLGLPSGEDMDGKVLINAFVDGQALKPVASWDSVAGRDGRHPPERQYDGASSVESLKQLVALGYVAPQEGDRAKAVSDCVSENRYNLARAEMDSGRFDEAAVLLRALIAEDNEQIRYHRHLFLCLLQRNRRRDCARMLDALDGICGEISKRAVEELKRRRSERLDKDLSVERESPDRAEFYARRQLLEKVGGFAFERTLMRCRLLLGDPDRAKREYARPLLEHLARTRAARQQLAMFLAEGFARLRDDDRALEMIARIRRGDRENWQAMTLEASIHYRAARYQKAVDCAIDSLSLIYFQPTVHFLLGRALVRLGDFERAEQSFQMCLHQAPGLAQAHAELAKILRRDQSRLGEVSLHMAHAEVLRQRARDRRKSEPRVQPQERKSASPPAAFERAPGSFHIVRDRVITIVTGLPRTGTSMMMQMLAAGGIVPYSDGGRLADEDNPRGYFEHDHATRLHQDRSWLPEARGKTVKIVAQLVRFLPPGEQYQLIFMRRDLDEVVASQSSMLKRLGRRGGAIEKDALIRSYTAQLVALQTWLDAHPEIPVLTVDYASAISDGPAVAGRLAGYLGQPFDEQAAASAIDRSLYRQRRAESGDGVEGQSSLIAARS
jgi:predicted AlkP superfamily phosphohydrolase/phosphomutase/tetratricopeptide (TPR) repeat protein